jgi:hypothetical protein
MRQGETMPTRSPVDQFSAHSFSDNYAIIDSLGNCIGCEHNQTEANALAAYLTGERGTIYSVRRNSFEHVLEAQQMFGQKPIRHPLREEAFKALGII